MTSMTDRFAARTPHDIERLVLAHPLAWVVAAGDAPVATLLPLRPVVGPDGVIVRLRGHFARSNPQLARLRRSPTALILFLGPHGYISPSWMSDRTQAPTWNYASVQFDVELQFFEDAAQLETLLRDLIGTMEQGRDRPWHQEEMGARYARLAQGIVGFDAVVRDERAKFKLGQDENETTFREIERHLAGSGQDSAELLRWMRDFDERS